MGTQFERADTTLSLGYWVRRQRGALDLTQKELARRAWCSVATIKKIEADQRRPSPPLAEKLAECLSVPDNELETFVQIARGNRAPHALALSRKPVRDAAEHNLPPSDASFVGREEELSTIGELLESPNARLLTLAGPGGVGKTKLAVQAAHLCVGAYEDGVWFVPLAGVGNVEYLPAAIAEVLGLQFAGRLEPAVQLRNYLRDKEVLLALDNFEQLLPEGLGLVLDLLRHAPGVTLLVTSRERLNVQPETMLSLQGLALDEGARLFQQRVKEADALLPLPSDVRVPAERICRLVDGLPLGIEMAAAWTRLISPEELASDLAEDLDLLVAASHDTPERHRSMRGVFEASWRRLAENERDVLRKLSVFRGGFTLEAAGQVAGATMRSMADLVDRSLVQRRTPHRLGLHELIRHYAPPSSLPAIPKTSVPRGSATVPTTPLCSGGSKTVPSRAARARTRGWRISKRRWITSVPPGRGRRTTDDHSPCSPPWRSCLSFTMFVAVYGRDAPCWRVCSAVWSNYPGSTSQSMTGIYSWRSFSTSRDFSPAAWGSRTRREH